MRFSRTTADCVSLSVSPLFRLTESPPAVIPMYCSPRSPEVRIFAELSLGNWKRLSMFIATTASKVSLSKRMSPTRPTTTPALLTGARIFRPPMFSNFALTWYMSAEENEARFATFIDRNSSAPIPTTAKIPTHKSSSLRVIMASQSSEHQCGQHEIERENRERRFDHRAGGGTRHALGRRRRVVALEDRDPGYRHPEHQALDESVQDVLAKIHRGLHLRPERALVDSDQTNAHQVAAEHPHRGEQRREQRHGDDAGPEARGDDARDRIDCHHFHRGKLLGRLHQADLRGDRAAGAAREQQPCNYGPELAHQRKADEHAQRLRRTIAHQRVVTLQAENHAHEKPRNENDDERQYSGEINLADGQVKAPEAQPRFFQGEPQETGREPEAPDPVVDDAPAQRAHQLQDALHHCARRSGRYSGAG